MLSPVIIDVVQGQKLRFGFPATNTFPAVSIQNSLPQIPIASLRTKSRLGTAFVTELPPGLIPITAVATEAASFSPIGKLPVVANWGTERFSSIPKESFAAF